MNRFTIIVMTESREDNDAVVHAVSALGADKEAEQQAIVSQLAADRDRVVAEAVETERVALRKRIHSLKLGPVKIAPGETKSVRVESRFPFHAACLKIPSEIVRYFSIGDLSFVKVGDIESRPETRSASSNPVPAAMFSDEGTVALDLDVECRAVKVLVANIGQKPHTFRGQIVGFRSESAVPLSRGVDGYADWPGAPFAPVNTRTPEGSGL